MRCKLCGYPGCNAVTTNKYYCDKHQALQLKKREEHSFKGMTRHADYNCPEWKALKKKVLSEHPYCQYCGSTQFLQVHHIRPVRNNPELFLNESNLMVLCRSCHFAVTQREIQSRRKG